MTKLARGISQILVREHGPDGVLERLSDPFWFQAFGCALGFDWHSSGLTTTVGGALKEGLRGLEADTGLFVAGGKGGASRKTPGEIDRHCQKQAMDAAPLIYASRMSAKVDSAAVQDGFRLYHHHFVFTNKGGWCVIQQGMNDESRSARRYHWLGNSVEDFVCEPHAAVCCDLKRPGANFVAEESAPVRQNTAELSRQNPEEALRPILQTDDLFLPRRHEVRPPADINPRQLKKVLLRTYEQKPEGFEQLLSTEGVGPKTLRALGLISELVYGQKVSFRDPARFSYAHGGKDGHPYPVNREVYDRSIEILKKCVEKAAVERTEKRRALQRLFDFYEAGTPSSR